MNHHTPAPPSLPAKGGQSNTVAQHARTCAPPAREDTVEVVVALDTSKLEGALARCGGSSRVGAGQGVPELHDEAAVELILAELVACTLGVRRRPELRVGVAGQLARMAQTIRAAMAPLARAMQGRPAR